MELYTFSVIKEGFSPDQELGQEEVSARGFTTASAAYHWIRCAEAAAGKISVYKVRKDFADCTHTYEF